MAKPNKLFIHPDAFRRTEAVVLAHERNEGEPPSDRGRRRRDLPRSPIRAILLESLDSGGSADCAICERIETEEIQEVKLIGSPTGGTFTLTFSGATTTPIPWDASADVMQHALESLTPIGAGNVAVALGKSTDYMPGIWIVTFTGKFNGQAVPLLNPTSNLTGIAITVTDATIWADSGRVATIWDVIPVGSPTPLRAGAVVVGIHFPGLGYGLIAAEAREFNPYYPPL